MPDQDSNDPDPNRGKKLSELLFWTGILLIIILLIGMIGFRYLVKLNWIDSFQNASFYISGMGPLATMTTDGQKLFSGFYAIAAGIFYLAIAAYLVSRFIDLEFFEN